MGLLRAGVRNEDRDTILTEEKKRETLTSKGSPDRKRRLRLREPAQVGSRETKKVDSDVGRRI